MNIESIEAKDLIIALAGIAFRCPAFGSIRTEEKVHAIALAGGASCCPAVRPTEEKKLEAQEAQQLLDQEKARVLAAQVQLEEDEANRQQAAAK